MSYWCLMTLTPQVIPVFSMYAALFHLYNISHFHSQQADGWTSLPAEKVQWEMFRQEFWTSERFKWSHAELGWAVWEVLLFFTPVVWQGPLVLVAPSIQLVQAHHCPAGQDFARGKGVFPYRESRTMHTGHQLAITGALWRTASCVIESSQSCSNKSLTGTVKPWFLASPLKLVK